MVIDFLCFWKHLEKNQIFHLCLPLGWDLLNSCTDCKHMLLVETFLNPFHKYLLSYVRDIGGAAERKDWPLSSHTCSKGQALME